MIFWSQASLDQNPYSLFNVAKSFHPFRVSGSLIFKMGTESNEGACKGEVSVTCKDWCMVPAPFWNGVNRCLGVTPSRSCLSALGGLAGFQISLGV